MRGNRLILMITIVLGLSTLIIPTVNAAPTNSELEQQRSEIQSEIEKAGQEISAAEAEIIELDDQIKRTDEAIEKNENMIEQTEEDISDAQSEIEELNKEITTLEETIEERNEILKQRAVSLQRNGGATKYFEVIMGSSSFGDFIDRVLLVSKMANADADLLEQHQADNEQLEESKADVEEKLTALTDQKTELEGMQAQIIEQKEYNEQLKTELKEKTDENRDLLAVLERKDRNLASKQEQLNQSENTQIEQLSVKKSSNKSNSSRKKSSNSSSSNTSSPTGKVSDVINAGYKHLGTPYVWAGRSPSGFDCSGFISWAFAQAGVHVSPSTAGLQYEGKRVSTSEMKPGDLVFFDTYKKNGHVGIYLGGNQFLGSQNSTGLAVADMNNNYWKPRFKGHVRRIIN